MEDGNIITEELSLLGAIKESEEEEDEKWNWIPLWLSLLFWFCSYTIKKVFEEFWPSYIYTGSVKHMLWIKDFVCSIV